MFDSLRGFIKSITEPVELWLGEREDKKISKMKIRDQYESGHTDLLIQKLNQREKLHKAKTAYAKAKGGL